METFKELFRSASIAAAKIFDILDAVIMYCVFSLAFTIFCFLVIVMPGLLLIGGLYYAAVAVKLIASSIG